MEAEAHGPDEIYDKFTVVKSKDVSWDDTWQTKNFLPDDELTNKDEFIFVLRPETNDLAAIAALHAYAEHCADTYPELATQIMNQLERIMRDFPEGNPALRSKK